MVDRKVKLQESWWGGRIPIVEGPYRKIAAPRLGRRPPVS